MLRHKPEGEDGGANPIECAELVANTENHYGIERDEVEHDADNGRAGGGEAGGYGVESVGTVEVAVLEGVEYVKPCCPTDYSGREHQRRKGEVARNSQVCADGSDAEREAQHDVCQRGKSFGAAIPHNDQQCHG